MLLENFDQPEYGKTIIILGDYVHYPISHFRILYPKKQLIVYQLEQMVGSETWHPTSKIINHIKEADEIWDYDHLNAKFLSWHDIKVDRVIPILYTHKLEQIPFNLSPTIDVLFYGYINERRYRILRTMQQEFYNQHSIVWLYGISGKELDKYIGDSKIILNLHAFEPWHRQEQVRIFYPVINQKLIVSETSQKNYFDDSIVEADKANLAATIKYWLENKRWIEKSKYAQQKFREISAART